MISSNPRRPLKKTQLKRSNPKRRAKEFARCYHSKARVEWVQRQPCVACGSRTRCENAHIENGGAGRKADYTKIVPLCADYLDNSGCHSYFHNEGRASLEGAYDIDLEKCAADVEARWQEFQEKGE